MIASEVLAIDFTRVDELTSGTSLDIDDSTVTVQVEKA